jgi:undecaprenyl-diphosphatase
MLAVVVASSTSRWTIKVCTWATAGLISLLVGLTRLYLGAHWLTDVIGGWILGTLWLIALLTVIRTIEPVTGDRRPRKRTDLSESKFSEE